MRLMHTLLLGLFAPCLFLQLVVAQPSAQPSPKKIKPASLTLAIADNGTGQRMEAIAPVAAYLSKELSIPVEATTRGTAVELLQGIREGSIDLAYINGFGYVLGVSDSVPLEVLVTPGYKDGTPNTYNSCIFTAPGSGIGSMADLVARAQQYSFMFVNPTSTSGHLVPRLYLSKMGIRQAEEDLKGVRFGESHYNTIAQVLAGQADAGATAYNIVQAKLASGELKNEAINILWVSDDITQEPLVVNKAMRPELKKKLQKAMLQLHRKDPALWAHLQASFSAREATNYVPAKDAYYNSIRNVSGKIDDLLFILNFYIN